MINLIGLTGLKQSGKTTAARYLRDTFAYHQADFATPIRSMVADMIGTTVEAMEHIKEQPHPVLGGRTPHILTSMQVRRLTPRECERLQGLPDDWTLVPNAKGKPMADGPRYKLCGNTFTSNVIRWIATRITAAHNQSA